MRMIPMIGNPRDSVTVKPRLFCSRECAQVTIRRLVSEMMIRYFPEEDEGD